MNRYPEVCPHTIKRTPMRMKWEQLTMLHWRYDPAEVQALLPSGLTVETFDGAAWVGLVPFQMRIDVPFVPEFPRVLHFPETNVRTYVSGRSGEPGVYFWSLEASSLSAVVTARTSYQVPYFWADMTLQQRDDIVRYETTRRWPGPKGARSVVEVRIGETIAATEASDLDRFLTARWALYGSFGPWRSYAKMYHEPWPLHRAELIECDDSLVAAAGLTQPTTPPLVHYSPGVSVRCGFPQRA